jgi:hypothetical protein
MGWLSLHPFRDQAEIYLQSKAGRPPVAFVIPSEVEAVTQPRRGGAGLGSQSRIETGR